MAVPHLANGPLGCLTISAGVASAPWLGSVSARALIAQADAALYAAKIAGRNVVCVAEAEGREGKEGQGALPPAPKLRTSP
jgi:PleD family two-component response regulator